MVGEIVPFAYEGVVVRTVMRNGMPWWIAADVCAALGIINVTRALDGLEHDEKGLHSMKTLGGDQLVSIINEPGLYSLILRSRKPDAKRFKRWVIHEVLPQIRRTGSYSAPAPRAELSNRELAMMVIAEADRAEAAERKVLELEPAAQQFYRWQFSGDTVYVVEWAKSIGLTQPKAYEALRELGVMFKQRHEGTAFNLPKLGYEKYFEMVDEWVEGLRHYVKVPKITAEGQVVLAELLLENDWIAP